MTTLEEVTAISKALVEAKKDLDSTPYHEALAWVEANKKFSNLLTIAQDKGVKARGVLRDAGLLRRYERLPRVS